MTSADSGKSREVGVFRAVELLRNEAVLVDVREPEEIAVGRAPEAVAIPLGDLEQRAGEIPVSATIVVVCRTGSRSSIATDALNLAGFDAVNLAGGMLAWQDAGFPVVDETGGAGFVL